MMLYSLLGWAPAYYMRNFGLDASQTGYILGTIILVANTSGALFCGWLIDFSRNVAIAMLQFVPVPLAVQH